MKPCCLTISSKSLQSIKNFLLFWENAVESKIHLAKKKFQKKRKTKVLSILKSPHVNKTAQEQFEFRTYSRRLWIYSPRYYNHLILIKKIKMNLFPDIKIKVNFFSNITNVRKIKTKILNPDNFLGNFYKSSIYQDPNFKNSIKYKSGYKNLQENTKRVVKITDIFGELILKQNHLKRLDSSVVEQRTENPWVGGSSPPLNRV